MDDSRRRSEQKRARKFQTSWMKGRPWLFHDKEADKMSCLWCTENEVSDCAFVKGTDNFKLDAVRQHETSRSHVYHSAKFKPKIIDKKSEAEQ